MSLRTHPRGPRPALLLCSVLYRDEAARDEALGALSPRLGDPGPAARPFPFTHTRYYEREMGTGLSKQIVAFSTPFREGFLPRVKRLAMSVEEGLREGEGGGRRANLDPGYLTPSALVLASTKGAPHRLYIGLGIFGEVTLVYHRGGYRPLPWTYPDYREGEVLGFLQALRGGLLRG